MLKYKLPLYGTVFLAVILFVSAFAVLADKESEISDSRPVIIIDAGHGGFDGGAVAQDGTVEKDINLKIAIKVEEFLKVNGFKVIMTRTEDRGTEDNSNAQISERKKSDMQNRLKLIENNSSAVYISIHLNKFTTSAASGTQVFYSANNKKSKVLAQKIQSSIIEMLQKDNDRVIKPGGNNSYLLKKATIPAVIVECGFLSNKRELELLKSDEYQTKISFAIASGILEYYKVKED